MKRHEDWVYESWTVDCVCGVNYDDGKEMVDCDECGIWVHTWCSRYVKGNDLFVCHKCKIKNNDKFKVTSKSLRMGNNKDSSSSQNQMMMLPLKPCLEIPIEDRVHVNGVPGGGDLGLFECVSSVFSSQLWKCCGYVPKKFRFQYSEWDEKEEVVDEDDSCGGVLFSMSEGDNVDDKGSKEKSLVCDLSRNKERNESREDFEDRVKKKVKVVGKEEEDDM